MVNLSSLIELDLVQATINSLLQKHEDMKGIADTQLQNGYSNGWRKELLSSANKIEALKELKVALNKVISSEDIELKRAGTKRYYVLTYRDDVVAFINPATVKSIDISGSQEGCINVSCRVYYKMYDWMEDEIVAFYGDFLKIKDIDMETATSLYPNAILWDRNPIVSDFDHALNLNRLAFEAYRTVRSKYNK